MKNEYDIYSMVRAPLYVISALVFAVVLWRMLPSGILLALAFAVLTTVCCWVIYRKVIFPHGSVRSVFSVTPESVSQTVKGKPFKSIEAGRGLNIYKSAGLTRAYLVFSRRELPQAELLGKYKKDPEVIVMPYFPRKMPKLKKFYDKAKMI